MGAAVGERGGGISLDEAIEALRGAGLNVGFAEMESLARRAGAIRGDGSVDLDRLADAVDAEQGKASGYEAHREKMGARIREQSLSARDIGAIPTVANPERREACRADLGRWCREYMPETFALPFAPIHERVIARIEEVVMQGGQYALGMPRGYGKSSLCEAACLWSMLNAHRYFVVLIGADEDHAIGMLESMRKDLETNDELLADYPEVCYPIRALEGINQRASGQLCLGKPTLIKVASDTLRLPTIGGSAASGAIVRVAGITGRIRGLKEKRADGSTIRPDLAIVDDPQTDESARSETQCHSRERVINSAVRGLAGPKRRIAVVVPCTVITPNDLAHRLLDRERNPVWRGERGRMLDRLPDNEALWAKYAEIYTQGLRDDDGAAAANAFYTKHRDQLDAGAVSSWPERHYENELSAVQHAMNWKITDESSFWSECQNDPRDARGDGDDQPKPELIAARVNRHRRRVVPVHCHRLTAMIDVQDKLLYYVVVAWADGFGGAVIDYGTEPEQRVGYFTLRDAKTTLRSKHAAGGLEAAIRSGLDSLSARLLGREWMRDDGAALRVERCLIDANWGESTDAVYRFCRESAYASVLTPGHGRAITAGNRPMREWERRTGDRIGHNWRLRTPRTGRVIRHALFDVNYWKSFVHRRLSDPVGLRSAVMLFGDRPQDHQMFAEHLCAEARVRTIGRDREVDEWKLPPHKPDNHFLDCMVGAAVAASMQGVRLPEELDKPIRRRRTVKMSDVLSRSKE